MRSWHFHGLPQYQQTNAGVYLALGYDRSFHVLSHSSLTLSFDFKCDIMNTEKRISENCSRSKASTLWGNTVAGVLMALRQRKRIGQTGCTLLTRRRIVTVNQFAVTSFSPYIRLPGSTIMNICLHSTYVLYSLRSRFIGLYPLFNLQSLKRPQTPGRTSRTWNKKKGLI
jgi:hypothetical protein